jgi:hypothetical protein
VEATHLRTARENRGLSQDVVAKKVGRQEITGADRQWAERYEVGDVVRYSRGSKTLGIEAGNYAHVESVDANTNQLTVRTDDERTVDYDPRRLQGVTLYRESKRAFANGDRVQNDRTRSRTRSPES